MNTQDTRDRKYQIMEINMDNKEVKPLSYNQLISHCAIMQIDIEGLQLKITDLEHKLKQLVKLINERRVK